MNNFFLIDSKMVLKIGSQQLVSVDGPHNIQFFKGLKYVPDLVLCLYSNHSHIPKTNVFNNLIHTQHITIKTKFIDISKRQLYFQHFFELDNKSSMLLSIHHFYRDLCFIDCFQDEHYLLEIGTISKLESQFYTLILKHFYNSKYNTKNTNKNDQYLAFYQECLHHEQSKYFLWFHNWYIEKWCFIKLIKNIQKIVNNQDQTQHTTRCIVIHSYLQYSYMFEPSIKSIYGTSFEKQASSKDVNHCQQETSTVTNLVNVNIDLSHLSGDTGDTSFCVNNNSE